MSEIYAHITPEDGINKQRIQTLDEHSRHVAEMAGSFASLFHYNDIAFVMGRLHDKGKEQKDWQKYIQGVTGFNKNYAHINHGPNHSYVGACIAKKQYPIIAPFIAQPIAGHHRGLYDYCDYIEETKREIPEDILMDDPVPYSLPSMVSFRPWDLHHVIRMLFSCLVDADSLDTEAFMTPVQAGLRGCHTSMAELLVKLEKFLVGLKANAPQTEVNHIRNYVQEQCVKESQGGRGFYSLTVPTGGGKTLASILWALHHAVKNNLQRVIIVIPYTSIIVQTASILKRILGEENILEHHSNVKTDDIENIEMRERLQLATENWDYPIVITTNVQFFESLFSNSRSECRKLHNIVNSVIILDEVQTLPLGFYKPIVHTLDTLQRVFGVSVLFTTASQPILNGRIKGSNPRENFDALQSVHEIIPREAGLHEKLRRVELRFLEGGKSYDEIAEELARHQRVLCIVNTRRDAKELYDRLPDDGIRLHLSRMMCPDHVTNTIESIRRALSDSPDRPVRVIATQLIEAGVDIDFPVVFRQEAGLDSILQAAGRCNREGKQECGTTYIFSLAKERALPPGFITQTNNARINMGQNHDWFAPEAMSCYFRQLHSRIACFDEKHIQKLLYKPECEFEQAARQFHLIDDQTASVIVNWGESMELYHQLLMQGPSYPLMKKLAFYSVNIREHDFEKLKNIGAIDEPFEGIFALTSSRFYKPDVGLSLDNQWVEETYII